MVTIGETILDEGYVQELREAIDCRREELKKVQKKMIEAKLDPREPQSKLAALFNMQRLLDPTGQHDGIAEAEAGQGDVFESVEAAAGEEENEELEQDVADFFGEAEADAAFSEAVHGADEEPEGMVVTSLEQTPEPEPEAEPSTDLDQDAPESNTGGKRPRRTRKKKEEEPKPETATSAAGPDLDLTHTGPLRFYLGSVQGNPDARCIIDREQKEMVHDALPFLVAVGRVRELNGLNDAPAPEEEAGPERAPEDVLILEAVMRREGAADRWQGRAETGLSDAGLVDALRDEIGPGDRGMAKAGSWKSSGGVHPMVVVSVPGKSGGQSFMALDLAARVRALLEIPEPRPEPEVAVEEPPVETGGVCEECFADLIDGACPDPECGVAQAVGAGR
jgi:hypothetical protein